MSSFVLFAKSGVDNLYSDVSLRLLAQNLRGSTYREHLVKETNICHLPTRSLEAHKPCHELLPRHASTFMNNLFQFLLSSGCYKLESKSLAYILLKT